VMHKVLDGGLCRQYVFEVLDHLPQQCTYVCRC